jgi:hypothetical protein
MRPPSPSSSPTWRPNATGLPVLRRTMSWGGRFKEAHEPVLGRHHCPGHDAPHGLGEDARHPRQARRELPHPRRRPRVPRNERATTTRSLNAARVTGLIRVAQRRSVVSSGPGAK